MGSVAIGIALMIGADISLLSGQLSGQGTTSFLHPAAPTRTETLMQGSIAHSAAAIPVAGDVGIQLALGMLLILMAFGLHAWITLRDDERLVPVHAAPKTPSRERIARTNARKMEVFYVEEVIRL